MCPLYSRSTLQFSIHRPLGGSGGEGEGGSRGGGGGDAGGGGGGDAGGGGGGDGREGKQDTSTEGGQAAGEGEQESQDELEPNEGGAIGFVPTSTRLN